MLLQIPDHVVVKPTLQTGWQGIPRQLPQEVLIAWRLPVVRVLLVETGAA
jgi:hypothetical protein